jgi:hypothetical protein
MKVAFAVKASAEILGMLKRYYHVPSAENAMDELLARTLCSEFAKITNPMIQHTDMAMDYYKIKELAPERFQIDLDQRVYGVLREHAPYKDLPEDSDGVVGCVQLMLESGLQHEKREQLGSGMVAGFGRVSNGRLDITNDQIKNGFKVFRNQ